MKKLTAFLLALVLAVSMAACSQTPPQEPAPEDTRPADLAEPVQKTIHVLLPADEDGWHAAVAAEASLAVEALLAEDNFKVQTASYESLEQQTELLEKIAAQSTGDGSQAVVTVPASGDMAPVFEKLLEANVAYALAGEIPAEAEDASVTNIYYDQKAIGAAMAAWMVKNGLTQDSKVVILQGFSETEALRTDGFKAYLQGKLACDGALIDTPWTSMENIVYSELEGETAENAGTWFAAYMEESDHGATGYIAAWDDAYLLGVLDALEGDAINAENKALFLEGAPFLAGCGGSNGMLAVLAGDGEYTTLDTFGGLQTVLYDTGLLETALVTMADHLSGQVVEQDQCQSICWVTAENAEEFTGY